MQSKKNHWFYVLFTFGFIICINFYSFTTIKLAPNLPFDACNNVNWATWNNFTGSSAVGTINNDGDVVNVTMTSNFNFASTPSIYNYSKFSSYPSTIPNSTVPQTTWSIGAGGTTTMCFSKTVTNPVLLIASLGASTPISATLSFSKPYVVLFDGGNMQYTNSTSLTGIEGYAIIMFPGDFDCVTINSSTFEFYTNITWGLRPPPFPITITETKSCSSTQLTASGGVSYQWNGGSTPNNATNTFTTSGTYIVTVANSTGCITSASKEVVIGSFNPTVTGATTDCSSVTLIVSGGESYLWSGGQSPNSATNTFTTSGNYSVEVTYAGGCTSTVTKEVTILSASNNSISTPQTLFCTGKANVIFTGTVPVIPPNVTSTFEWEKSDNGVDWITINNEFGQNYTPSEFYQNTYFRRVTVISSCKYYSNAIKIDINPQVTTANAGADISLCNIALLALDANPASVGEIGTWSVVSPVGFNPFNAGNINNPKATFNSMPVNTPFVLRWTIKQQAACLLESFDDVTITNYTAPAFSMVSNMTINAGQSLAIPATITTVPGITYTYQWSPIADLNDPTILSPIVSPAETAIYHLKISYDICSVDHEIKIIVNQPKILDLCSGKSITLIGAVDNDSQSIYQWQQLVNGVWADIQGANGADYSLPIANNFTNATVQTEYRRLVVNSPYFDSRYLINILATTNNNTITTAQTTFCESAVTNLAISGSVPNGASNTNITFTWQQSSDGNTWTAIPGTAKDLLLPLVSTTTFYRRITYADACESYSNVVEIAINPSPTVADAGDEQFFCGATTAILNANAVGNNEIGTWSILSPTTYQPFNSLNIHDPKAKLLNLPLNEPVILQWSIDNHNCNTTTTSDVTITSYKDVVINAPKTLDVDLGKSINLGVTANLESNQSYTLDWSPNLDLSATDILSPNASPKDNTIYTLKIYYGQDCMKSVSIKVNVLKEISFPNSFSPNGDGINDVWEIKNFSNYPGSKLSVYNRYGSLIFQSYANGSVWDGKFKGQSLPTGTYYYVITLKDKKSSVFTGEITILN
jgi:gliding motility-associated-like protein